MNTPFTAEHTTDRIRSYVVLLKLAIGNEELAAIEDPQALLAHLKAYCERKGVHEIMQLTVGHLDAFRATRWLSPTTPTKGITDLAAVFRVSPQQIDRYMCLPCRVEFNALWR